MANLPLEHAAYPRRRPRAAPVLARVRVAQALPPWRPEPIAYSEFDSEFFGGEGATTTVVYFPGDPAPVAWDFQRHPMPPPRRKGFVRGFRVPAPTPQTVSNLRRRELAEEAIGAEALPGKLDIFEGTA